MDIRNIIMFTKKTETEKVSEFGFFEPDDLNPININKLPKLEDVIPIFVNDKEFLDSKDLDVILNKFNYENITIDNLSFLGIVEVADVLYKCFEMDSSDILNDKIKWFNIKNIINVQNSLLLSIYLRLFLKYYFKFIGKVSVLPDGVDEPTNLIEPAEASTDTEDDNPDKKKEKEDKLDDH